MFSPRSGGLVKWSLSEAVCEESWVLFLNNVNYPQD